MTDLVNAVSRWILIGPWPVMLLWEMLLIFYFRQKLPGVWTLSQQGEHTAAHGFEVLAYCWGGLGAHMYAPWKHYPWPRPWDAILGVLFWVILGAYLCLDTFDPRRTALPAALEVWRDERRVFIIGILAGYLLFPQQALEVTT